MMAFDAFGEKGTEEGPVDGEAPADSVAGDIDIDSASSAPPADNIPPRDACDTYTQLISENRRNGTETSTCGSYVFSCPREMAGEHLSHIW